MLDGMLAGNVLVDAVLLILLDILPVQSVLDMWRYGTRSGVVLAPKMGYLYALNGVLIRIVMHAEIL